MIRILLSLFLVVFFSISPALAQIDTAAKQAYIIDYETGTVLYSKNADEHMPTSSMSKVMTALAVFEALETGRLSLDEELMVSEKAWRKGGSKMFVEVGKQVSVEDLLRGVIVQSGNDATIVLAEGMSGSEEQFAQDLNALAKRIGMNNSHFTNASGWPDPDHYSTAKDLAVMARYLIQKHKKYYGYYGEKEFTYNKIQQTNRNPLLYQNIGADGIKTGHTEDGGYGLIGSAQEAGRRVIIVLNGMDSAQTRAEEARRMVTWALKGFVNKHFFNEGQVLDETPVIYGQSSTLPLIVGEDIFVAVPERAVQGISAEIKYDSPIMAPVEKHARIGTLLVTIPEYGQLEYPLLAGDAVAEKGAVSKLFERVKLRFKQLLRLP